MPRACPEHPEPVEGRRGGKRIGAGAPTGNFNALKHGRHSPQARAYLFTLLQLSPIAALTFARRTKNKTIKKIAHQARLHYNEPSLSRGG